MTARTRFSVLLIALATGSAEPLAAQHGSEQPSSAARLQPARPVDPRLVVERNPERALELDTVAQATRSRWRYPVIGAGVGLLAGIVHAHAMTRGDYVGLPAEPMYVLPPLYAAAGGFVGLLIDSADRERKARRD